MIRPIILAIVALTVTGCASTKVRTETVYVPVQIDASFFDPALCPWPRKADFIVQGTDSEAASYDLAGYNAYRCERAGRLGAGARQEEIIRDAQAPR